MPSLAVQLLETRCSKIPDLDVSFTASLSPVWREIVSCKFLCFFSSDAAAAAALQMSQTQLSVAFGNKRSIRLFGLDLESYSSI